MNTCYIVGAGDNRATAFLPDDTDFVIAADGGLPVLKQKHIRVDLVLGDFDSLGYVPDEPNLVLHPTHKDETDMMLACREGLARGYRHFCLYGGVGGTRISHTIANLQTLVWLADQGACGTLYGDGCEIMLLRKDSVTFGDVCKGFLSLFAVGGNAVVTAKGPEYELEHAVLTDHYPLGVSNAFCGKEAVVTAHEGDLLVVVEKETKGDAAPLNPCQKPF